MFCPAVRFFVAVAESLNFHKAAEYPRMAETALVGVGGHADCTQDSGDVSGWTSRIETSLSDPQKESDASQHRTEIAYLLKS